MGKDARPQLPNGNSPRMFFARCVWWCIWGGRFPFANTDTVTVEYTNGHYFFKAKPSRGGGGAGLWPWMYDAHRELDPTQTYSKGKCAYVSPQNTLATIGLVDLDSAGATVKATPGVWLALQDIPAQTTSGYNVPQDPMPSSGGATSGTPLVGDADATSAKWLLLKSVC